MTTNTIGNSSGADAANATAPVSKKPTDRETFLQLLVAQIRHQNPLNPADGVQFLTQLAQFSELEQMMEIRGEIAALRSTFEAGMAEAKTGSAEGDSSRATTEPGERNV